MSVYFVSALLPSAVHVRQPCDRLRFESQGIRKRSYDCRTNSQCRPIYRNVAKRITTCPIYLLSACNFFLDRAAVVRIRTTVVRVRTAAVRTTYEINNRLRLPAVRLSYEFATQLHVDLSQRRKEDFDMPIVRAICLRFFQIARLRINLFDSRTNLYGSRTTIASHSQHLIDMWVSPLTLRIRTSLARLQ